jgi:uncharacterized protein
MQVLTAMGVTAIVLLLAAKLWLYFSPNSLLPVVWKPADLLLGIAMGVGITAASAIVYRFWPAYRQSADYYLELVLKPLVWSDLLWLGLLPGMSEELLFRGLLLPTLGLNAIGIVGSSLCFGILHLSGSQQWSYVVWATIVGMLLGFSAVATGNLLVPIVAHIVTNLVSSYFWKFGELKSS